MNELPLNCTVEEMIESMMGSILFDASIQQLPNTTGASHV
jgi:hypothetical protein